VKVIGCGPYWQSKGRTSIPPKNSKTDSLNATLKNRPFFENLIWCGGDRKPDNGSLAVSAVKAKGVLKRAVIGASEPLLLLQTNCPHHL